PVASLRDQVRQVLDRLRATQQRLHGRVLLEVLHQVVRRAQGLVELAEQRAASNRQRVVVGVDEHEPRHAHRRIAKALDRAPFARLAVETLFDEARIELHDLLHGHRDLVWPQLATQGLAVDDGVLEESRTKADPFTDDRYLGVQIIAAAGADPDDTTVLDDQALHHGLGHDHRARLLRLLREPRIETRAQDCVAMRPGPVAQVLVRYPERLLWLPSTATSLA